MLGWTGAADCSVRDRACGLDCSEHGACRNGTCACSPGWHGLLCATSDNHYRAAKLQQQQAWRAQLLAQLCPNNCSAHGTCMDGACYCLTLTLTLALTKTPTPTPTLTPTPTPTP